MTDRDDRRPLNGRQAEALDRYLDDRARGTPSVRTALDRPLVETVHRLQGLADATVATNLSDDDEAQTWETLMRMPVTPWLSRLPSTGDGQTSDAVPRMAGGTMTRDDSGDGKQPAARIVPISRPSPPSRLRRFGSRSLGLVATLTLVSLLGLSGLALYLSAPRPDVPDGHALLAAASPTADTAPADSQEVFYAPCDVTPRNYNELMAMLSARILVADSAVPPSLASESTALGIYGPRYHLPEGSTVSPDLRAELVGVLGSWTNCNPFLRAALSTDDYLVRNALEGPIAGPMTFFWWLYSHPSAVPLAPNRFGEGVPPIPDPSDAELNPVGTSADVYAYGFRMLDQAHIAAYLASPLVQVDGTGPVSVPVGPPRYEESGYVVFVRQPDGRWLVDEWHLNRRGADTNCYGMCATPVSP